MYMYLGGPLSTCPFSVIAVSGTSPLGVWVMLGGTLVTELFGALEPVLGLGSGEDEGGYLDNTGGEYDLPLDHDGLLGGVGGSTATG